jgi:hypothetical protein
MGAEDEFRRVGEDVRQLARALRQELKGAQWQAKDAARQARNDFRRDYRNYRRGWQPPRQSNWAPPQRTYTPRPPRPPRPVAAPRPARPPRPPRPQLPPLRHKRDGSTLLSLLLVLVGLAWLVSQTKLFNVSFEAVLAATLALLGAGMVVTARTDWSLSRKAWPAWVGCCLFVMLLIVANSGAIGHSFDSMTFGPVTTKPATWAAATGTVSDFAGPITVDLTQLPATLPGNQTLTVHDTFGPVTVDLPAHPTYHVHVNARVVGGSVTWPADATTQTSGHSHHIADINPSGTPTLTIDAQTVFGPITASDTSGSGATTSNPTPQ